MQFSPYTSGLPNVLNEKIEKIGDILRLIYDQQPRNLAQKTELNGFSVLELSTAILTFSPNSKLKLHRLSTPSQKSKGG